MARATVDQPPRRLETEAAQPADNKIGGVCTDRKFRSGVRSGRRGGRADDELADVAAALHQTEGVHHLIGFERASGERRQGALGQKPGHLLHDPRAEVRPGDRKLIGVNGEVGDVLPERAQAHTGPGVEVALPELEEAAERPQQLQTSLHRLAGDRVQHHVHALAGGEAPDLVGEALVPGIQHVVRAVRGQERPLGRRSGRGEDDGAPMLGVLDGGEANSPRRTVDQHPLPWRDAREMTEGVDGGQEGDRDRGAVFEADGVRQTDRRAGGGDHPRPQGRRREGDHPISG